MSYIIYKKCGRYYKLKEGESPDEIARKCECGGYLNYVQNFDMHVIDDFDPFDEFITCPDCGKEILKPQILRILENTQHFLTPKNLSKIIFYASKTKFSNALIFEDLGSKIRRFF